VQEVRAPVPQVFEGLGKEGGREGGREGEIHSNRGDACASDRTEAPLSPLSLSPSLIFILSPSLTLGLVMS